MGLSPSESHVVRDAETGAFHAVDTTRAPDGRLSERADLFGEAEAVLIGGRRVICRTAFAHLWRACEAFTPERAAEICWIDAEDIRGFGRRLARAERVSYYCWTGVGQHANATQTDRAIACLFALTGQFDRPGGNVAWPSLPLSPISDHATLGPDRAAKALGAKERPLGPASGGWVTGAELYRAILEEKPYRLRALVGFGGNPLSSQPDPGRGAAALGKLELQVHCDLFLNPSAMTADIVLPVSSAWERDGLRAGFEISLEAQRLLHLRPAMVDPVGEARSDFDIVAGLAERLGFGALFAHGDWEAAQDAILAPLGVTVEALRGAPAGLSLPLDHGFECYATSRDGEGPRGFSTPTRRVEFYSSLLQAQGYPPVPDFIAPEAPDGDHPLVLTTAKNGYYCHTQHRGLSGLRRKSPTPRIDLHPRTAAERGIADRDPVEILRGSRRVTMEARLDPDLHPGVVVAEYGWWQAAPDIGAPGYPIGGETDANYNSLATFETVDPVSGAPAIRSLCCQVRLAGTGRGSRWPGYRLLRVVGKAVETPGVTALTLAPDPAEGAPLAPFKAGQFLSLRLPGGDAASPSRSYSLIGRPETAPPTYRIAIRRVEGGAFSGALGALSIGDRVEAACPDGHFTLPFENEFPVVLIAAGIGITPFMSLLEQMDGADGQAVWLYYMSRNGAEHAFRDRIADIASRTPRLTVRTFYTRPMAGDIEPHERGRVTLDRIDAGLFARRARFYLCGPDDMLKDFRAGLIERGVPDFEIFLERFTAPRRTLTVDPGPHRVLFKRRDRAVDWRVGEGTILDLAEKHGLALPAGCRTGQCESCAVSVLSGEVAHHGDIATDEPDRCLACQAYPLTDLVLDA